MNRREFIALVSSAAAWPLTVHAQQPGMAVVGFLRNTSAATSTHLVTAFRQGLGEVGYVEGQKLQMVVNPNNPAAETQINVAESAARALGLKITIAKTRNEQDFDPAFANL